MSGLIRHGSKPINPGPALWGVPMTSYILDEDCSSLAPEVPLPPARQINRNTQYHALAAAVLEQAILDLDYAYKPLRRSDARDARWTRNERYRIAADARRWFLGDGWGPYTFSRVCELLNLDEEAVRDKLLTEEQHANKVRGL